MLLVTPVSKPRASTSLRNALFACLALALGHALSAGTLLRQNFETADWPARSVSASDPAVTASVSYGAHGTIDVQTDVAANGVDVLSKGLLFSVNSAAAPGAWSAALSSGVLTLSTANTTITDLGLLTLSFSLRASRAHPVIVRLESFAADGVTRTGGLSKLIHPAAPDYTQRFALDLSTMQPEGAGAFAPTATKIRVTFELDSAAGGDGWPAASGHTLKIDNLNYATPAYYVAASGGADNTTGGRGTTAALPHATINYALGRALPGDIIVVRGGTYNGGVVFRKFINNAFVCIAGEPDAWVVLKNYPGEKPILRHTMWGVINIGLGTSSVPYTGPASAYLEVRGLTVRGFSTVDAHGDRNLDPSVANLYSADPAQSKFGKSYGETNCNGISIEGRRMTNLLHDLRFADNIVEFNSGGGIGYSRADRVLIENNISRNNCWWMAYAASGFSSLVPADFENNSDTRAVFQGNQSTGNETMYPWIDDDKFSDGNGIIIDVNRNDEVGSGSDPAYRGRTLVQNNLTANNGGSGIHAFNAQNVDIFHNTAYLNSASPRLLYSQIYAGYAKNARMIGNILVAPDNPSGDSARNESYTSNSQFNVSGTIFYQNNLYHGLGNNLTVPAGQTLNPSANFTPNPVSDPLFIAPSRNPAFANFRLRAASPARNTTPVLASRSALDVSLAPRPLSLATTDKGAYQTQPDAAFPPLLTPVPGNYLAAQSVTLGSDTAGATFIYTTNGTTPTVDGAGNPLNGTLYTGPISVPAATTLQAIAWKAGLAPSPVSGGDYTFIDSSAVPIPDLIFHPESGTYEGTTLLAIVCRTPGALVRYTTDGSTPTPTTGTLISAPMIPITERTTLKAIAYLPGRPNSAVKTADYAITGSFGNVSAGTVLEPLGANKIRFSRFTATTSNTLASVYANLSGAGTYRVALYSDTAGAPVTRRATSNALVNPAAGWNAFTFSTPYAVTAGTDYWLAIWSDNAAAQISADTSGGTVREVASTLGGNGTWPTTAPATTASTNGAYAFALYATPRNFAPSVTIPGTDPAVSIPDVANLTGAISDDGFPLLPGATTVQWTKVGGPGTVTFSAPTALVTTASFSSGGDYVLRLTATDGSLTAFAETTVTVAATGGNPEQVIYRETFGNALGSATPAVRFNAASIGWRHYTAPNDATNVTDASGTNGGADHRAGRPATLDNVNAGVSDSAEFGYAQSLASRALVFTTEYTIDRSVYVPTILSWYSHISATNSGQNNQSPAVRIAGQWYVITLSTAPAGNLTTVGGGANFNTSATVLTLDFATATATTSTGVVTTGWHALTASPGVPFVINPAVVSLPTGNIEAFGVYFTTAGFSTARFDSFEIKAILTPTEPTATNLASAPNPAEPGAPVTLTATVTSGAGTPSGTVTFLDGAANLGSATLNGSGVATFITANLAPGSH
ncbi:MAG: chitobiase/beta-hexosaminidase C-terminal domain-containing protein, partial [Burkholderiales bacterium]|nr:chitobiase/beta-hexosaminidase C-terminal domain-containing protein [Opitutaceae bacterium]